MSVLVTGQDCILVSTIMQSIGDGDLVMNPALLPAWPVVTFQALWSAHVIQAREQLAQGRYMTEATENLAHDLTFASLMCMLNNCLEWDK